MELYGFAFVISFAFLESLYVDDIAWNDIRNEDYFSVGRFGHRDTFGAGVEYFYMIKNKLVCIFSSHAAKVTYRCDL